jgi:hypothetical protein
MKPKQRTTISCLLLCISQFFFVMVSPGYCERNKNQGSSQTEMWPAQDVMMKGYAGDCIVYKKTSGKCVADVKTFNGFVDEHGTRPTYIPLDSVKALILEDLLQVKYFAEKARQLRYDTLPAMRLKMRREIRVRMNRFRNQEDLSDDQVRTLYKKYYASDFSSRKKVIIDLLGSSDSSYINSIYKVMVKAKSLPGVRTGAGDVDAIGKLKLPWRKIQIEDLPAEMRPIVDSLREGDISKPLKTPCGVFIARIYKVITVSEVPFDTVKYELLRLYGEREICFPKDSQTSEILRKYYDVHKDLFPTPDTINMKVWLVPGAIDTSGEKTKNALIARSHFKNVLSYEDCNNELVSLCREKCSKTPADFQGLQDTLHFTGMAITQENLPVQIRDNVTRAASSGGKTMLSNISTPFGFLYVKVLSVKKGQGVVPYERAKRTVLSRLSGQCANSVTEVQEKQFNDVYDYYLANAYEQNLLEIVDTAYFPTKMEINNAIMDGWIDTSAVSKLPQNDSLRLEKLRSAYRSKMFFKDYFAWRKSIGFLQPNP